MRSPRSVLLEQLKAGTSTADRFRDVAFRVRVWRRGPDGKAAPAELLEKVHGGRYDTWTSRYSEADPPEYLPELSCHPGQLALVAYEGPEVRTLLVGAPGGGKTFAAVLKIAQLAADRPNSMGGAVAPTVERRGILWDDLLDLMQPHGWVKAVRKSEWEIELWNGVVIQIRSTKKQGRATGTPVQGYSWDWAVEDEQQNIDDAALNEVNFRGRRAGPAFRIYSTATNQLIPEFQLRLEKYRELQAADPPKVRIIKFKGSDNVFVDPEHWENQRSFLTPEAFERLINADDQTPSGGLVYPKFLRETHLRELPHLATDITHDVLLGQYHEDDVGSARYIVGHDRGKAYNYSVILRAFREPSTGETLWWAVDEVLTEGSSSQPEHAQALARKYPAHELFTLADPHTDEKEKDRSDFKQFRAARIRIRGASATSISRKHRWSMVNVLFCDGARKARLFVGCKVVNGVKYPLCPKLLESLTLYRLEDVGKKGPHDVSHASDGLGYGLYPFEKIRGSLEFEEARRKTDPILQRLALKARRKETRWD